MARGDSFGDQGRRVADQITGVEMHEIGKSFARSMHMHYETPTFTRNSERIIWVAMSNEGEPWRLMTSRPDGSDTVQLSGDGAVAGIVLDPTGESAIYIEDGSYHRTRLDNASDDVIAAFDIPGALPHGGYIGMRSYNGRYCFTEYRTRCGAGIARLDVESGEQIDVRYADNTGHPKGNPGGPEISYNLYRYMPGDQHNGKPNFIKWTVHMNCETLDEIDVLFPKGPTGIAHSYWLGTTGRFQGTQQWPGRGIAIMERDTPEARIITSPGPYFWHSGASYNGQWIVADTNFPYEGLWLICVETGRSMLLCKPPIPFESIDKPLTHPHPNMSDDGSHAVFSFTRNAHTYLYVVPVTRGLRNLLLEAE